MSTFDPKLIDMAFGPVIFGDYAKGTFVKVSTDGDDFSTEKGADGKYERINNNNNLLTVEITLKHTSPINDLLSAISIADRKANSGVFPFIMKDNGPGGTTLVGIELCHIKKRPDVTFGDSLQAKTWVLEGAGEMIVGGNT